MLNMLGATRIYTVPEVNALLRRRTGFRIVDKLPDIRLANQNVIYFKTTGEKTEDSYPVVIAYIVGVDPEWLAAGSKDKCKCTCCTPDCCPPEIGDPNDHLVWYTTGDHTSDYEQLKNLPSINGETFLGDMDEDKARRGVSGDGTSGGYNLSLPDEDIADIVREAYE